MAASEVSCTPLAVDAVPPFSSSGSPRALTLGDCSAWVRHTAPGFAAVPLAQVWARIGAQMAARSRDRGSVVKEESYQGIRTVVDLLAQSALEAPDDGTLQIRDPDSLLLGLLDLAGPATQVAWLTDPADPRWGPPLDEAARREVMRTHLGAIWPVDPTQVVLAARWLTPAGALAATRGRGGAQAEDLRMHPALEQLAIAALETLGDQGTTVWGERPTSPREVLVRPEITTRLLEAWHQAQSAQRTEGWSVADRVAWVEARPGLDLVVGRDLPGVLRLDPPPRRALAAGVTVLTERIAALATAGGDGALEHLSWIDALLRQSPRLLAEAGPEHVMGWSVALERFSAGLRDPDAAWTPALTDGLRARLDQAVARLLHGRLLTIAVLGDLPRVVQTALLPDQTAPIALAPAGATDGSTAAAALTAEGCFTEAWAPWIQHLIRTHLDQRTQLPRGVAPPALLPISGLEEAARIGVLTELLTGPAAVAVARLQYVLATRSWEPALVTALRTGALGTMDRSVWRQLLLSPSSEVRLAATQGLGHIGDAIAADATSPAPARGR